MIAVPSPIATSAIAERSGSSVGVVYRYFPNADAVLVALALWSAMGVVNPRFKDVATMRRYNNRTIVWNHTSMLLREWSPWVGFGFGKKAFKRAYYENPNQRAPFTPDRNLIFPHAHSYWRMVRFEGSPSPRPAP